ncbi:MAG TPA: Asp-tRNA(Asn)/Glu-tRNA(Gln) amidotransferase subunit GatA [Actinomycetota bacterium]|nr:Asp-tRNA(Asn)/Glu-tRNA(Gln) amidotransferase subunit GatA [Actinomycetota bacterium]
MELCDQTATELADGLRAGEISSVGILDACLERVASVEERVGAFLARTGDLARTQAVEADRRIAAGDAPAVAGIPLALKDVLSTRGVTTTCGSRILETYVPPYDCTPWARLAADGSVLLGKTNCDEFAMGSSNENSAFGPVRNPWDLAMVPGGSSGGSAAAVAAGEAVWALGTDTGGSVRQPASLCGVVGLKPTYGLISRYGLIAFASSLDAVGTFTRSVRDAAVLLSCIAGKDPMDATSLDTPRRDYTKGLEEGISGLRVGVVTEAFGEGVEPGVRSSVRGAIDRLSDLGASTGEVSLPHTDYALSAYYLIAPSEASSNLARYDGVRYGLRVEGEDSVEMMTRTRGAGFGAEVKRRIMLGTYALSAGYYEAYYGQAQKVRTLIIRDYEAAFERFDLLVSPTSPTTAFPIGAKIDDPLAMYLNDVFTIPANLSGMPAISIPSGLDDAGLPVGVQLTAPVLEESRLLRAAFALEQPIGFDARPPTVAEAPS